MPTQFSGGCACGAIRYQCTAPPLAMYNCHCQSCHHAAGGAFAPLIVVAAQSLDVRGIPKRFFTQAIADSHSERCFCSECGSPLFTLGERTPDVILVHASSLDEPDWFKPVADIWTVSALPWANMDRHIPKVFKSPPLLEPEGEVTL